MDKYLVIGIAGGSGSGKTTLMNNLIKVFGADVTVISHDNYYKRHDELSYEERCQLNYDEPAAFDTDLLVAQLEQLRCGRAIDCPVYDFTVHNRSENVIHVVPKKVIIVEGILIFENRQLRELMDIRIFVDTDADIRLCRRVKRDVNKRGRTLESVLTQYQTTVKPMHEKYVEPSKKYAHLVVLEGGKNTVALDMIIGRIRQHLQEHEKKPESLIFDIDGTLWDSTELVAIGYNRQLQKENYTRLTVTADMLRTLFGRTMQDIADRLFPDVEVPARYGLMERCMASEGEVLHADPCNVAYPGVVETLTELAKSYRLFIVSNSQSGYPQLLIDKLGIGALISGHLCYGDTGTGKGETILTLMKQHNITDAVYIGDTQGDLESSEHAGLPFVFCAYGFGKPDHYDYRVEAFTDLTTLFPGKDAEMSIGLSSVCLECHLRRNLAAARKLGDEKQATAFAKELMKLYIAAPENASAPYFSADTDELFRRFYGLEQDRFREEKRLSNAFVLSRMDAIRARVEKADDPVYAALQFAILGNYIDYSALAGEVSMETLDEMLTQGESLDLPKDIFVQLCTDLSAAKNLLYLTDNAGEIGFDRILAEEIHRRYPEIDITFCVRGGPALNDATREDAAVVGIPFRVIDNGTLISGTVIERLGTEAKAAFETADVILSKGQGNVETMLGCGYNVYYAFLVKCEWFQKLFHKEKFTPMLLRDPKHASAC